VSDCREEIAAIDLQQCMSAHEQNKLPFRCISAMRFGRLLIQILHFDHGGYE